eukprot:1909332-Rhodomonas_salina.1
MSSLLCIIALCVARPGAVLCEPDESGARWRDVMLHHDTTQLGAQRQLQPTPNVTPPRIGGHDSR